MKRLACIAAALAALSLTSVPSSAQTRGTLSYVYVRSTCSYPTRVFVRIGTGNSEWENYGWYPYRANETTWGKLQSDGIDIVHKGGQTLYLYFELVNSNFEIAKGTHRVRFNGDIYYMKEVSPDRMDDNDDYRITISCPNAEKGD